MSQDLKFDLNDRISYEYSCDVKEEFRDEYCPDNKVCISETAITDTVNVSSTEINEYLRNDRIKKYDEHIKTDIQSSEVNDSINKNVKIEDGISPAKLDNEFLFCNHCQEVYQDYCTKCRVLVHILNERPCYNTYNKIRELPKYMLETRESIGRLGIFTLKVIPEDVRFGPFTGLDSARGSYLRIKGGRFMVTDDKLEHLNWMQYINPARNICEQNLIPLQYEDKLYYCSTRRIQEGEELLVYFGEKYEDNLLKNVEMDFVPIAKKDVENVFACIFCCLGFSSKEYLAEHKAVCQTESNEIFSVKELAQCSFCKLYLDTNEYVEHHMDYCCETNARYCVLPKLEVYEVKMESCSSLRGKAKSWKRGKFKCTQCKFETMYNADFRHHINEHYKVKMYKCGICHRRYKARESLKAHVENIHTNNEGKVLQKYSSSDYFKANIKHIKERPLHLHDDKNQCQDSKCKFQTRKKCMSEIKHLNRGKYKCANCEFKTYYGTNLERHMKIDHLMESNCKYTGTNYNSSLGRVKIAKHLKQNNCKCTDCEFKTNYRSILKRHIKTKHLKQYDYKCGECEYQTNLKSNLQRHVKGKHLKQNDYNCTECEYKTNIKSYLQVHIKAKHLKGKDYKCMECEYQTGIKSNLKLHIKIKHLKQNDYKCVECEYQTNLKANLERHIKGKHLKQNDYNCSECEFKTNIKSYLQAHIKAKHLKGNDYKCTECEFKTNYKSVLEVHTKAKHVKRNDYKCMECEYETNFKSNLEIHIKSKHLKQKDYKCAECEFKTNYKSLLQVHVKAKHLNAIDYKCGDCEYKTNIKLHLERHIKARHLKQNDYKCRECEYKTNMKSNFERHIKANHLKQNDYKCMECEFKTNIKSYLKKHMKRKHLKENDYK